MNLLVLYRNKKNGIQHCASSMYKVLRVLKSKILKMCFSQRHLYFLVGVRFFCLSSTSHYSPFSPQSSVNEEFSLKKKKRSAVRINRPHRLLIQLSRALELSYPSFHSEDDQFWVSTFKGQGVFEGARQDDGWPCLSSCVLRKCRGGLRRGLVERGAGTRGQLGTAGRLKGCSTLLQLESSLRMAGTSDFLITTSKA